MEAQAKILWAIKQLGYRNQQLEENLAGIIPELHAIMGTA